MKSSLVTSDQVTLSVETHGAEGKRPVVLLHGIAQSKEAFAPLVGGPMASAFRFVTVDMRGHGESDAPEGAERYASDQRLGQDLHALLAGLSLERPIVLGWSYGGVVIGEYLRRYGSSALGAVALVGASMMMGRPAKAHFGPVMMDHARGLMSEDAGEFRKASEAFARGSFAIAPSESWVEQCVERSTLSRAHARRALLSRAEDFTDELRACQVPVAVIHGREDRVVLPSLSEHVLRAQPNASAHWLEGVGHWPWIESAAAFEYALGALAARAVSV